MKKLNLIISVFVLMAILLFACSSEKSNSPIDANQTDYSQYFPTTIGSWWILENYTLDDNMERVDLISIDSLVVTGEEMKGNKMAKVFIRFNKQTGEPLDTTYYFMDGVKIYEYTTVTPFSEEEDWILTEDFEASKGWTVLDTNVKNVDMGSGLVFTGNIKVEIEKGEGKTLEIKNNNFETKAFDITLSLSGNMSAGTQMPLEASDNGHLYFAKGIGNVQHLSNMSIEVAGQTTIQNNESIVVDYNIK